MKNKPIEKRLEEVKHLFGMAEYEIKKLEQMGDGLFFPAINQLRYVGPHILKSSTAKNEEDALTELDKAEAHCWRAITDCAETGSVWALEKLKEFQEEYTGLPVTNYIPEYKEILELSKNIKLLLNQKEKRSPEEYYSKINEHLPLLVEKLSVVEKTRDILHKELKSKQNASKRWLFGLVISIVASLFSAGIYQGFFFKEPKKENIQSEIDKLEAVQRSLSSLQSYVASQQSRLEILNKDINALNNKRESLEQVVDINEKAVHELLRNYESLNTDISWVGVGISFVVGSLSSLFVVFFVNFLKRKRLIENTYRDRDTHH